MSSKLTPGKLLKQITGAQESSGIPIPISDIMSSKLTPGKLLKQITGAQESSGTPTVRLLTEKYLYRLSGTMTVKSTPQDSQVNTPA
jgi:hypothetical protein